MTTFQKVVKYLAFALAIFLVVAIISGILSAIGLFGGLFDGEDLTGELKTYPVNGEIRNLEIEVNAADLCIKEGDAFSVESNLKKLKVEEKNGHLTVKDTAKNSIWGSGSYKDPVLTIYVPKGTVFENIELTTGAGRLTPCQPKASSLSLARER